MEKKTIRNTKEIGARLRTARKAKGWKQKDLSEWSGVKQGTIGSIESGTYCSYDAFEAMCDALDVSQKVMLEGEAPLAGMFYAEAAR